MGVLEYTNIDASSGTHPGVPAPGHKLQEMMLETEQKLRRALSVPEDYRVLYMHGGAVGQFAAVPMNLLGGTKAPRADYLEQGYWSQRAIAEARKYGDVHFIKPAYTGAAPPSWEEWGKACRPDATYLHVCLSETVEGVELLEDPPASYSGPPIVLDATSTLLSRPINISSYALVFASGGKNLPAGMAVVIVRASFLKATKQLEVTPAIFDYRTNAGAIEPTSSVFESRPNTPPTFAVYMLGLVLDHLEELGGVQAMEERAEGNARKIYEVADKSGGFYKNVVHPSARSRMNAVFNLPSRELEKDFLHEAEFGRDEPLLFLFGHPVKGGVRVTMYNWVSDAAIEEVTQFMQEFASRHAAKSEL